MGWIIYILFVRLYDLSQRPIGKWFKKLSISDFMNLTWSLDAHSDTAVYVCLLCSVGMLRLPALLKPSSSFHWEWIKCPYRLSICSCSRWCYISPQLQTTHAKVSFHIWEKDVRGHSFWRYTLTQTFLPRKHCLHLFRKHKYKQASNKTEEVLRGPRNDVLASKFIFISYLHSDSLSEWRSGSISWEVQ